jgi:triacylglycerol lipase
MRRTWGIFGRSVGWTAALAAVLAVTACGCGSDKSDPTGPRPGVGEPPPVGAAFDVDQALELARLSLQAYQMLADYQAGTTFTLPAPYTLIAQYLTPEQYPGEVLAGAGSEVPIAFVATRGDVIFVVYRGTKTITEWIKDATFGQVENAFLAGGGLVEQGFSEIYATIHDPIVTQVQQLIASASFTELYVTGHSLGAALAVLSAPELAVRTSLQPALYSFAGPRVGDPVFALAYTEQISVSWRTVNTNDLVPTLPPPVAVMFENGTEKLLFYEHVASANDITFGTPIRSPSDIEEDHSLCNYYDTLCAQTLDPSACEALANGADGCNPPS